MLIGDPDSVIFGAGVGGLDDLTFDRIGNSNDLIIRINGTTDTLIPIEMGRQIHAAAPSSSKQFLAAKGAGHTDLWRSDTLPKLYTFIDQFAFR